MRQGCRHEWVSAYIDYTEAPGHCYQVAQECWHCGLARYDSQGRTMLEILADLPSMQKKEKA